MSDRLLLTSLVDVEAWYNRKFMAMGQVWHTPDDEWWAHLARIGVRSGQTILDVGCGDGSFLQVAESSGLTGEGIDISGVAIAWARRRKLARMGFIRVAAERFIPLLTYDVVTCLGSFEHFIQPTVVLRNIRAALAPAGVWYFQLPNERWTAIDQPNERSMPKELWCGVFTTAGLTVVGSMNHGENSIVWGTK